MVTTKHNVLVQPYILITVQVVADYVIFQYMSVTVTLSDKKFTNYFW